MTGSSDRIAITGMSGRFPGAQGIAEFWENLRAGRESTETYTDEELLDRGVSPELLANPNYVKSGAPMQGVAEFDPGFFGLSPRDGAIMDPQHRHFLECAWEALEDAGCDPGRFEGSIGVFAGSGHNAYLPYNLLTNPQLLDQVGFFLLRHTGNDKDFLATRVSYCFDLKGPSVNVQTACSTSLVAIHNACQSLLNGECDLAIAGGVTIELPDRIGYLHKENEILSADGHCRPFDASSSGTIFGSGAGAVVLRRLPEALEDRDNIHAVVIGSAINNDGSGKVGYLAPSVDGQAACIAEAIEIADVPAETISYVEAHGTGTAIGDPIEVAALTQAFGSAAGPHCVLGSVKSNIGHLDTAAGIAGVVKIVESMKHREIPPTVHFEKPNPKIDFSTTPFRVTGELEHWESAAPLRAGISSLGVGGTNAHIILEEAPVREPLPDSEAPYLLVMSAKSPGSVDRYATALSEHLSTNRSESLSDVAHTLACRRKAFDHRGFAVVTDLEDAIATLEGAGPAGSRTRKVTGPDQAPVFMFTGQGSQYAGMGRGLYERYPVYRQTLDRCAEVVDPLLGRDIRNLILGKDPEAESLLVRTELQQPAIVAVEMALATLLESWGIKPGAMIGHSLGEYVAATIAGVFSLEDMLAIVAARGRLMATSGEGAMISIPMSEADVAPLLTGNIGFGSINSESQCVVSGPVEEIDAFEQALVARGIEGRRLRMSIAAHSCLMDPVLDDYRQFISGKKLNPPSMPFISNVTGTWIDASRAADPEYWVSHIREPVRFHQGLSTLLENEKYIPVEVGPGRTLASFASAHPSIGARSVVQTMRHPREETDDASAAVSALGRLWQEGIEPDWNALLGADRYAVSLPTYQWDHQDYWIEPGSTTSTNSAAGLTKQVVDNWFYQPAWKPSLLGDAPDSTPNRRMLVIGDDGTAARLVDALREQDIDTVAALHGSEFASANGRYTIRANNEEDIELLLDEVGDDITDVVYCVAGEHENDSEVLDHSFFAILKITKALAARDPESMSVSVVTSGMQQVGDEDLGSPLLAAVLGPVRTANSEFSMLKCRSIDLPLSPRPHELSRLDAALASEVIAASDEATVALRGTGRFVQDFERTALSATESTAIRSGSGYLVTGGIGGVGASLIRHVADAGGVPVVLCRTALPPRDQWYAALGDDSVPDRVRNRIREFNDIDPHGDRIIVLNGRADSSESIATAFEESARIGHPIAGVLHTAGVLRDGLIQFKTDESANEVFAPKIGGVRAIEDALETVSHELDFIVLFSSLSAFMGLTGQVDYTAANAVMDAWARHMRTSHGVNAIALDWSVWADVGMAAELGGQLGIAGLEKPVEGERLTDGFFDARRRTADDTTVFVKRLSPERDWLLDEHRVRGGDPVIPGTGYLEMIRDAHSMLANGDSVELRDVVFMAPFTVPAGESRELSVRFESSSGGYDFTVIDSEERDESEWQECVRGRVESVPGKPEAVNLDTIRDRCTKRIIERSGEAPHAFLQFGDRWKTVESIALGDSEALLDLKLPDEFVADLETYHLHPAMVDMATGAAQDLIPDFDQSTQLAVPVSYGRVTVHGALEPRVVSHVRYRPTTGSDSSATFDVTITRPDGTVIVEIEDFTMKKVAASALKAPPTRKRKAPPTGNHILEIGLRHGILASEGVQVLERVLSRPSPAQLIVSAQDLHNLIEESLSDSIGDAGEQSEESLGLPRPDLTTEFVPPSTDLQETIATVWQAALGISSVGIEDNFFELGGHSLLLTQIVSRLKKTLDREVPLGALFDAATVAQWEHVLETHKPRKAKPRVMRAAREAYKIS